MEEASKEVKNKTAFDGSLPEHSSQSLLEFAKENQISHFSQTLAELLSLLEWQNEKQSPGLQDAAIYNSLLRVEKAANNTSTWELCDQDEEGPMIALSVFELNMLEQTISMYLVDFLINDTTRTLFFPLNELYCSDVVVKWRILNKIACVKVTPQQTIYKHKLTECMRTRVQDEVKRWLDQEFQKMKFNGKHSVLKDIEVLTNILKQFESHMSEAFGIITAEEMLFTETSCSYFDCLSMALDEKLYPVCVQVMRSMDVYQEYHKSFQVNLRDSCALSYAFYRQIKKLVEYLRPKKKMSNAVSKMEDYSTIFINVFMNLMQVIKSECHHRIKRAVELETKDTIHIDEKILSSSVIVLNCICTVIDEWKHIEIEDDDLKIAFIIKITDIVCDGVKIFAEALDHRLTTDNESQKDIESTKKACILANSVEHVRVYLENLSNQMQWKEYMSRIGAQPNESTHSILRILNLLHHSMESHLQAILVKIFKLTASCWQLQCEKHLSSWVQATNPHQAYDKLLCHLNEFVDLMQPYFKENLFPKFLSQLWYALLMHIQNNLQEGLLPEYAKSLKDNVQNLLEYFLYLNMEESEVSKPIFQQISSVLDLNSKTTVELQLDYFSHVAESIVSPIEYLGHIAFQAGYKVIGEDSIDLYIKVQKGQRLPARKFEMNELFVRLELCPRSLFPNHVPLKTPPAIGDLDNPVFNQSLQFSNLPLEVLSIKGAVVQVLVLNQDKSYSAEAVLLLNQVQNMSGFTSIEFLPVYLMPLRKFDMSQIAYQVLENRSKWDKTAKQFIKSRNKVTKRPTKLLSCISKTRTCIS